MSCGCETKCFTIMWKIENFSLFSTANEWIASPVWKTETTEDHAWWRFLLQPSGTFLEFQLTSFASEMKDYKYEMSLLTSSGEIKLTQELCTDDYCCSYKIERNKIFGETSDLFLLQGTLTLYCRIWLQKLKPGRCFLRTALHEVNLSWVVAGFSPDADSTKRSLHEQEEMLLTTFLYKLINKGSEESTHRVRIELLPYYGKWSTFFNCRINIGDERGRIASCNYIDPVVGFEWDIVIYPEECTDGHLCLGFECLIIVDKEHPKSPDAAVGFSTTLSRDLLQLYRKKTFSDVTLNTDGDTSLLAHKNILAARSRVFEAMFERDQTIESRSGVVYIDDVDSETMDWLLVYLYTNSLEKDLRWEQASILYYAADKYAVLPLKQECAQVLMVAMTADNVCDALVLADRHSDEPLMSCAVDFVRYNQEVLSSPAWENLEESHSRLTTKVLRQILLQKDKK